MKRWWIGLLLVCAVFAQDDDDDDEIIDDSAPIEADDEPEPTAKPGAAKPPPTRKTAHPARGKKHKVVWVAQKTARPGERLKLPADWVVRASGSPKKGVLLDADVLLPGGKARAALLVLQEESIADARLAPLGWRDGIVKAFKATDSAFGVRPLPWVSAEYEQNDSELRVLYVWTTLNRNVYLGRLICRAEDFDAARTDLFGAMKRLESDKPLHPSIPKHYKQERAGRYLLAVHPSVKRSLKTLKKLLKTQEKRFVKFHGSLPKDPPVVVYVHAHKDHAEKVYEPAAKSDNDYTFDIRNVRLFAVPVPPKNVDKQSLFMGALQSILYVHKYGTTKPDWAWVGERSVARAEQLTTKKLPYLHPGMAQWGDSLVMDPLDGLKPPQGEAYQVYSRQAFFWVCMLRGSKRKTVYKAMLKDLEKTGDPEAAFKKHFGALELHALKGEAQRYKDSKIRRFNPEAK